MLCVLLSALLVRCFSDSAHHEPAYHQQGLLDSRLPSRQPQPSRHRRAAARVFIPELPRTTRSRPNARGCVNFVDANLVEVVRLGRGRSTWSRTTGYVLRTLLDYITSDIRGFIDIQCRPLATALTLATVFLMSCLSSNLPAYLGSALMKIMPLSGCCGSRFFFRIPPLHAKQLPPRPSCVL